jgi:TolA-binding protein
MKKFTLSAVFVCALCVAAAVAQMAPSGAGQGTQQSSPSSMGRQPQPGAGQPDQNAPTGQEQTSNTTKSEKKLKGCVQSQGGQYVLETKKGKDIALSGQDVSAHVGHEVAVKGTWEKGGSMSQTSSGTASSNEKTFNVSGVDMISDTCGGKSKGKSSEMGTGAHGTNPTGTGAGTTGSSGTGTQPPQ